MAERELSILVRAKGALQAARDIGGVNKAVGTLGANAKKVAKGAAIATGAAVGAAAIVVGRNVRSGLESLALLEDAESSVQGAIEKAGQAGQLSAKQVSGWANEIETSIDAAFDDKDITLAASTLIRFGKVVPSNLKPALQVMTDLAVKTGSIESASTLLAKALADPAKAAGKLARVGIVLTKSQQDQIKAFVKAGKMADAQRVILDELTKTTQGAAKASAGPYRDSLNILTDVTEDAQRALATGFLPVITKVRDLLSKELAKPQTLSNIKKFGEFLAGGLSSLIDTARGLPWDSIGAALQIGGIGAKAILGAFSGMPPWVQTAVVTGWGLNKLTGGALAGVIGELGKGLIKGVLGMNAGVVNIKAGAVTGVGGAAGATGAVTGGTSKLGKIASVASKVFLIGAAVGVFAELKGILDDQSAGNREGVAALGNQTQGFVKVAGVEDMKRSLEGIIAQEKILDQSFGLEGYAFRLNIDGVKDSVNATKAALVSAITQAEGKSAAMQVHSIDRAEAIAAGKADSIRAATNAVRDRVEANRIAVAAAASRTAAATAAAGAVARAGGLAAAAAIRAKDLSVTTINRITIPVSVRTVINGQRTLNQYTKIS